MKSNALSVRLSHHVFCAHRCQLSSDGKGLVSPMFLLRLNCKVDILHGERERGRGTRGVEQSNHECADL